MGSIRLNNEIRKDIVRALVARKFDPIKEKLDKRKDEMANKLYNIHYTPATRKKMDALPEGWLGTDDDISFNTATHGYQAFYFPKTKTNNYERRRFLSKDTYNIPSPAGSKICDIIGEYIDDVEDYKKEREKAKNAAMTLLQSVTTVNRAIEIWPEAELFIRDAVHGEAKSNAPLPVVMTENLNKQLGLPPSKKEAA